MLIMDSDQIVPTCLLETDLKRARVDLIRLMARGFDQTDTGHLQAALDHVECVIADFDPSQHSVNPAPHEKGPNHHARTY